MEKVYKPQTYEQKIYKFWEKEGFFEVKIDKKKKPFVITLPPPNVTGSLHAGHAMLVVEDIIARFQRMRGRPTLFLPGFDHASIAVEYLVSKKLAVEGKSKREVGREEFLKRAREFAEVSRNYIRRQFKKLGFSLDWSREAYTMDKTRCRAVQEAFQRLYKEGLIYQGERIINWCPTCKTVLSDLENEHQEEKGELYYLQYGPLTIATARPETIFADVAVAVHPKDKRYQKLVGQTVPVPLTNRRVPIIQDSLVDPSFGSGALKITPGHDKLDFEIGRKHKLPRLIAIDFEGKLTEIAGRYQGLKVEEAKRRVISDLRKEGLLVKKETIVHSRGYCYRCHTPTEPLISKQWFVKVGSLARKAIEVVKKGEVEIIPKRFQKIYFNWLENIHDWCISRQLWWGHKIPLKGEEDVLDTWFSSALWPISVFGWPKNTEDFQYFYPTTLRETGYDILFSWVAREIMMCTFLTGKPPYQTVYLHGLVRDKKGRKFSKTKGIGFDPLIMTEKYGTDALRMALVVGNAPGHDLKIGEDKIRAYRNFANKIWNASRFVLANINGPKSDASGSLNKDDRWILQELDETIKSVTASLENFRFGRAGETLYQFFWHQFCDKYIEVSKKRKQEAWPTLIKVLATSLRLLHPFMPYVTEVIWQKMKEGNCLPSETKTYRSIMVSPWPKVGD